MSLNCFALAGGLAPNLRICVLVGELKGEAVKKFLIIGGLIFSVWISLRLWQSEWKPQGQTDMRFASVPLAFSHTFDKDSLPFVGSAVLDIDGDGVDEVFLGGGRGQKSGFFKFLKGAF